MKQTAVQSDRCHMRRLSFCECVRVSVDFVSVSCVRAKELACRVAVRLLSATDFQRLVSLWNPYFRVVSVFSLSYWVNMCAPSRLVKWEPRDSTRSFDRIVSMRHLCEPFYKFRIIILEIKASLVAFCLGSWSSRRAHRYCIKYFTIQVLCTF